jgi:hypothetical protein
MAQPEKIAIPEVAHAVIQEQAKLFKEAAYAITKANRTIKVSKALILGAIDEAMPEHRNSNYRYDEESMTIEILPDRKEESVMGEMMASLFKGGN